MPRNCLSLTVGVRCEQYMVALGGSIHKIVDQIRLAFHNGIFRLKIMIDIHAQLRAGQIPDMPVGRHDIIVFTEIFFDCAFFRW